MGLAERFGARLRRIRTFLKLTQEELCAKIGINQGSLSAIERGRRGITMHTMDAVVRSLNIHPADLFLEEDFPPLVLSRESLRELLREAATLKDPEVGQLIARARMMREDPSKAAPGMGGRGVERI